jgi:hypothetical protein
MTRCPQCGWTGPSAPVSRAASRLGKIELVSAPHASPLELPPEEPSSPGSRPGLATSTRLELPDEAPLASPSPAASVVAAGPAPRLELPPEADAVPELAPLPLPTEGDGPERAPHFQTSDAGTITLPAWLTEPLDAGARRAAVLTAPLVVLTAIDALTAGRPALSAGVLSLQALVLTAATAGLVVGHRGGAIAAAVAGLIGLSSLGASGLAFAVWTAAVLSSCLTERGRALALAAGLGAVVTLAPVMLDGTSTRPVLGALRASLDGVGPALKWPVIDQHNGLQLTQGDAALRLVTSTDSESRLVDPERGLDVAIHQLPSGLELTAATRESQLWFESLGLSQPQFGRAEPVTGEFDASTVTLVSAQSNRATISGLIRVGVIGSEAFAVATWTRAHRTLALTPVMQQLMKGVRYRPAARPRLAPAQRASVSPGLVTSLDGRLVGARVSVGPRTVLLLPAAGLPTGELQLKSEQGSFPVDLSKARLSAGVRVAVLGGGMVVPMRAASRAPRLSRFVVAGSWSGGWLSDEPGAAVRATDLIDGRPGPAFDLDGQLLGVVTSGARGPELVTVDALVETMAAVAGSAPRLSEAPQEAPPPLFQPLGDEELRAPASASDVMSSVLLGRSAAGLTGAVVIGEGQAAWVLVADAAVAPPGTRSVSVRLPSKEVRVADIVRVTRGVVLLKLPREDGDGLRPMKLVEGAPLASARRVAWGFRDDPATATVELKSTHGLLSPTEFDAEPGPALSTGPVVSPDNRLAALRSSGGPSIVEGGALQGLGVAGLTDVVWRIAAEPTGTCQLAATIELEDPLEEASLVRVRVEPATDGPLPARVKASSLTDVVPAHGRASFVFRFPCFTTAQLLQFEVQGPSGVRWSLVQHVPVVTVLPGVIRGRTGPSEGAARGPSALVAELWELPTPLTHQHPCRTQPSLCERACMVDELDACTLDGRHALATKEVARAVSRFDAMCEAGDLEACTLLTWAIADTKKPGRALRSKPEGLLGAWCQGGLRRACVAMAIPEWRKTLATRTSECEATPRACGALGLHLLDGPRLDGDLARALKLLQQACRAGDVESCAHSGIESLRFGREEPLAVMPRLQSACDSRIADACTALTLNAARGITVPRMPQAAEQQLDEACRLGSTDACLMTGRP